MPSVEVLRKLFENELGPKREMEQGAVLAQLLFTPGETHLTQFGIGVITASAIARLQDLLDAGQTVIVLRITQACDKEHHVASMNRIRVAATDERVPSLVIGKQLLIREPTNPLRQYIL